MGLNVYQGQALFAVVHHNQQTDKYQKLLVICNDKQLQWFPELRYQWSSEPPPPPPPQGSLEVSSLALPSLKLLSVISWCLTNYQVPEYGSRLVIYVEHDTKVAHLFQRQKLHSEYTKPIRKMTSKFERLNKSILGHTGASTLNYRPQNSLWPFVIFRTQRAIRVRDSKSFCSEFCCGIGFKSGVP